MRSAAGAAVLGVAVLALGSSGCTSGVEGDAARAADDFVAAVADGQAGKACALLAPASLEELEQSAGRPCAEVVLDEAAEAGDRLDVSAYGTMAQVRYADDVLFLSRFDGGWRVVAAGCSARRGGPYSCGIEGR